MSSWLLWISCDMNRRNAMILLVLNCSSPHINPRLAFHDIFIWSDSRLLVRWQEFSERCSMQIASNRLALSMVRWRRFRIEHVNCINDMKDSFNWIKMFQFYSIFALILQRSGLFGNNVLRSLAQTLSRRDYYKQTYIYINVKFSIQHEWEKESKANPTNYRQEKENEFIIIFGCRCSLCQIINIHGRILWKCWKDFSLHKTPVQILLLDIPLKAINAWQSNVKNEIACVSN